MSENGPPLDEGKLACGGRGRIGDRLAV